MTSKVLSRIDEYFGFAEAGTNLRTETIAGATTFMTMAYIIVVNPAILSNAAGARMNFGAVMTATCVASAFATLLMAVLARYPIALAPGMGLNAFFSFEVCTMNAWIFFTSSMLSGLFVAGPFFSLAVSFTPSGQGAPCRIHSGASMRASCP